jgi:hypothetical protein
MVSFYPLRSVREVISAAFTVFVESGPLDLFFTIPPNVEIRIFSMHRKNENSSSFSYFEQVIAENLGHLL